MQASPARPLEGMRTTTSHQYALAPHVHACRAARYVVLLDIRRDEYLGIGHLTADALSKVVSGIPPASIPSANRDDVADADLDDTLKQMISTGMVVSSSSTGEEIRRVSSRYSECSLLEGYEEIEYTVEWIDVVRFVRAIVAAHVLFRWRRFEHLVGHLVRRRQRMSPHSSPVELSSEQIENVRRLLKKFQHMKTFLYTTKNSCLFDSLALSNYLAKYRIFPTVVFGVDTDPFTAHCWLQQGAIVINDSSLDVRRFTQILCV